MIRKILTAMVFVAAVFGCAKPEFLDPDMEVQMMKAPKKDKNKDKKTTTKKSTQSHWK